MLAKMASLPPRSTAWASAITLSAYDVVLRPAVAPCSLRVHGTVTTMVSLGAKSMALHATTSVGGPPPRPEPIGCGPAL